MIENTTLRHNGIALGQDYAVNLSHPWFKEKLHNFDPRLRLVFNKTTERWDILECIQDDSGGINWKFILCAEDESGNPKPLGDWVINKLFVMRETHRHKMQIGADNWFKELKKESDSQKDEIKRKVSEESQYRLRHDIISWRKAANELDNLPASDVTAGYRKIQPKNKGKIVC